MYTLKHILTTFFTFLLLSFIACTSDSDRRGNRRSGCDFKVTRTANLSYGSESNQTFHFYAPNDANNKIGKKPLVILLHQGAFVMGSKDDALITQISNNLARCGVATAAIDYRLLQPDNFKDGIIRTGIAVMDVFEGENSIKKELYNAIRDARSAIRYFKINAEQWGIDPDRIYIAGYSAGAIVALQSVFMDEEEAKNFYFGKTIVQNQGCLDCRGGNLDVNAAVRGVIAVNGALFDANFITDADTTPVFIAYSENDNMIPTVSGRPFQKFMQATEIDLPSFQFEIGITGYDRLKEGKGRRSETQIDGLKPTLVIPANVPKLLIDAFTSDIFGSKYILSNARQCKKESLLLPNIGHNFAVTGAGETTPQYYQLMERVIAFIHKDAAHKD